jgi:DnaJ-class molecular chaperone
MAKLPCVSGARVVKALERLGFVKRRQRGSHVVLRREAACAWCRCIGKLIQGRCAECFGKLA